MNTEVNKIPKVSVVCAWYNRADYIKDTVDSLLNQNFDDYEIIIANDGSPDPRVKEILDSYDDPRLTVIHKENEGFTKTIKMLVEKAKAPYVAIQGAGDVSYPDRLRKQYEFLSENPDTGVVGAGFDIVAENGANTRYKPPLSIVTEEELKAHVPFTHGTVMYNKDIYLSTGGYDVRFKYCSDWDLYFRILESSKIKAMDESLYKKIEFNDGFSFSPLHKFAQTLYKEVAVNRDSERAEMVDSLKNRVENLRSYQPHYLYMSIRYAISFLKKGDFTKSYLWFLYFIRSFFQIYKNFKDD